MSPFYDNRILACLFPFEILQTPQLGTSTRFVYLSVINTGLNLRKENVFPCDRICRATKKICFSISPLSLLVGIYCII